MAQHGLRFGVAAAARERRAEVGQRVGIGRLDRERAAQLGDARLEVTRFDQRDAEHVVRDMVAFGHGQRVLAQAARVVPDADLFP